MKKYVIILLFVALFIWVPYTYGLTYKDPVNLEVLLEENTQENINKTKLLKKYALEYKQKISELQSLYDINNVALITDSMGEVDLMISVLNKIQTKSIERNDAEEIIASIVDELKNINSILRPYLKKQQEIYEEELLETKRNYIQIGNKISSVLYSFIERLSLKLSKKERLTQKEKEVVLALVRLNETRNKIDRFGAIKFGTKADMRDYYLSIIRSIRKELQTIKNLLN